MTGNTIADGRLTKAKTFVACGAILTVWWVVGPSPTRAQTTVGSADVHLPIQNAAGLRLLVAIDHTSPVLRVILPGRPTSDRSIEILFPEHITVVKQGQGSAQQLYLFRPGQRGDRPLWRRSSASLEYERDLGDGVHLLARATLEGDGVRFRYELTNKSRVAYDTIYVPTDPRLTSIFHDVRLDRTYVHHADGFDLLASETPRRLTIPLDQWLPARYLASFTWPVPAQRIERRDDGFVLQQVPSGRRALHRHGFHRQGMGDRQLYPHSGQRVE